MDFVSHISPLPNREQSIFKNFLGFYDKANYDKALISADDILKTQPRHPETLALKGIVLYNKGRKEEALATIKQGLMCNFKSMICWHCYGLYYRLEKNYTEAIKCFKNALKWDPKNLTVLRDLGQLQMFQHDFDSALVTRRTQMITRFDNLFYILHYSVAAYLSGRLRLALAVIEAYLTLSPLPSTIDPQFSEVLLYKARILMDLKRDKEAFEFLETVGRFITDKLQLRERLFELSRRLKLNKESTKLIKELLKQNPNSAQYYQWADEVGVEVSRDTDYAKMLWFKKIDTGVFAGAVGAYAAGRVRRGAPLHVSAAVWDSDGVKRRMLLDAVEALRDKLEKKEIDATRPSTLLYCYQNLANLYCRYGDNELALTMINKAIEHTPTMPELYITKAKILKHLGKINEASDSAEEGRKLDLYDRYLNIRSVGYLLRAGKREQALSTMALFLKEEDGDFKTQVDELQNNWFELLEADSYFREEKYGLAMKQYKMVEKHFKEMRQDEYDFHNFYLRKNSINDYINLVLHEERIDSFKNIVKALLGMAKCYRAIAHSQRPDATLAAQRRAERQKLAEEKKKEKPKMYRGKELDVDVDPEGLDYTECENPLLEALHVMDRLIAATKYIDPNAREKTFHLLEINTLAVKIYIENEKPILALAALKRAMKINKDAPSVAEAKKFFLENVDNITNKQSSVIKEIIEEEKKSL